MEFSEEEREVLRLIAREVTTDPDRLREILRSIGTLYDNLPGLLLISQHSDTLSEIINEKQDEIRARARLRDRLRGIGLWGGLIGTIIAAMALARELRALWHGWPPP